MNKFTKIFNWALRLTIVAVLLATALTACMYWPTAKAYDYDNEPDGWTVRQSTAHVIAELARGIGLSEDNPIIVECQRIWWEDANFSEHKLEQDEDAVISENTEFLKLEPANEQTNTHNEQTDLQNDDTSLLFAEPAIAMETAEIPETRMTYLGEYSVTGYDICPQCTGKTDGITTSGVVATVGRTVAAGYQFEYGTHLYIEGLGEYVVEDRGPSGNVLDVLCSNHSECYAITGVYSVWMVED